MLTLEAQIARLADAAEVELVAAPEHADAGIARQRWPRLTALAAAFVLVVAGVAAIAWRASTRPPEAPASIPTVPATPPSYPDPAAPIHPVTVDFPDEEWWLPTYLPQGAVFELATADDRDANEVLFTIGDPFADLPTTLRVTAGPTAADGLRADRTVDVAGVEWSLTVRPESPTYNSLYRLGEGDEDDLLIEGFGIAEDELVRVAASLGRFPATVLPRPPLPSFPATGNDVAAITLASGREARLVAASDGVYLSLVTSSDGSSGGGGAIRLDGRAVTMFGGMGNPGVGMILSGATRPDVAQVDIALMDGSIVSTAPVDTSGEFPVRFILMEIPEVATDQVVAVVARDADGNEIARDDTLFG